MLMSHQHVITVTTVGVLWMTCRRALTSPLLTARLSHELCVSRCITTRHVLRATTQVPMAATNHVLCTAIGASTPHQQLSVNRLLCFISGTLRNVSCIQDTDLPVYPRPQHAAHACCEYAVECSAIPSRPPLGFTQYLIDPQPMQASCVHTV